MRYTPHTRQDIGKMLDAIGAGGLDDLFEAEGERVERAAEEHDAAVRRKACESKNRYASRSDAEEAIASCAAHGTRGLHCYRCPYCNGWHLTSKPVEGRAR